MQQMRLDSKDGLANGWAGAAAGAGDARNLPDRASAKAPIANGAEQSADEAQKRGWLGATFRFARNAAIGLLLLTAIPVSIVGLRSRLLSYNEHTTTLARLERVERLRPLTVPKDASITPMQAGLAFHALQQKPTEANAQFPMVKGATPNLVWPWRSHKLSDEMFLQAGPRSRTFDGAPPEHVIESAAAGTSAKELAWLREVAEAPLWKNFDLVAAAQTVDLVGGQFQIPFRPEAFAPAMPLVRFAGTKELAYASMSRAAYYLAIGQPDKSEAALRSVVSFGFALIDNASGEFDAMLGSAIVNIGRNGLEQFATATHRPNELVREVAAVGSATPNTSSRGIRMSVNELHQRLLKDATDPNVPRGIRMGQLSRLAFSSCTNVSEMLFGQSAETDAAFADAQKTLARFPSEVALLDIMRDATNRVPEKEVVSSASERFIMGAAVVAATITNNPRIATCTRIAVSYW